MRIASNHKKTLQMMICQYWNWTTEQGVYLSFSTASLHLTIDDTIQISLRFTRMSFNTFDSSTWLSDQEMIRQKLLGLTKLSHFPRPPVFISLSLCFSLKTKPIPVVRKVKPETEASSSSSSPSSLSYSSSSGTGSSSGSSSELDEVTGQPKVNFT